MSNLDPVDIQAQERAKAERDRQQRLTSMQGAEDFKWLMSDKRGRRFIWGLLAKTGVFKSSFTGDSETFFREGARNIGLMLMDAINEHCPDKYAKMAMEQRDNDRRHADDYRRGY